MGPLSNTSFLTKCLAGALSVVFFFVQGVWGQRVESNFWTERAEMSRRLRQATGPSGVGSLDRLPPVERVVFSNDPSLPQNQWESIVGSHGIIRDVCPTDGPLVFFVQDVHGHRSAQENVAKIILSFLARYPRAPVVLEGAAGPIALSRQRNVSVSARQKVAAFFFNTGFFSGAEYAVWAAPIEPLVFGGEDAALYKKNRAALDRAHGLKPRWEKRLKDWKTQLNTVKESVYSIDLKELDLQRNRWAAGNHFSDRILFLAQTHRIPPPPAGSTLATFVNVLALEKSLDLDRVSRDRTVFIERLSRALTPLETEGLAQAAFAIRSGDPRVSAFYGKLKTLAASKGIALQNYPDFGAYVRYVLLVDQIRPEQLHQELDGREQALWRALIKNKDQERLQTLDRDMALLEGLSQLELTPAQWDLFKENRESIAQIQNRLASFGKFGTDHFSENNEIDFQAFIDFYDAAENRNHALVNNVLAARSLVDGDTPVLLVAGGFHSDGVSRLLSDQKAGWVTVAPRFSSVENAPGAFGLFYRDRTPLELLFDSPRVTLSQTLAIAPITPNPRAQVVTALSDSLETVLADQGPPIAVKGNTLVVSHGNNGPPELKGDARNARPVITNVGTEIGKAGESGRRVSVYQLPISPLARFLASLKKGGSKFIGVALLGAFLLPFSGMPQAHAYTMKEGAQGVQVMVEKGQHLWGAATHILKVQGNTKPSNAAIQRIVNDLVKANAIKNPDRIAPGTYTVTAKPEPPPSFDSQDKEPGSSNGQPQPSAGSAEPPPSDSPMGKSDSRGLASFLWGLVVAVGIPLVAIGLRPQGRGENFSIRAIVSAGMKKIPPSIIEVAKRMTGYATALIGFAWIASAGLAPGTMESVINYLAVQWRLEMVLFLGLAGAVYYIWFRAKETNLFAVEQSEPRLREWNTLLDRIKDSRKLSEEDLSRLVNNLHALVLNNRVTGSAVADRGALERRIDVYRALSRLSQKTVAYLDRQLSAGRWPPAQADRLRDVREKFFLYQLYGVKVSNALVPASVSHWALSNYDRESSWFERRKIGRLLRLVRGIPAMLRVSVREYKERLLLDEPRPGQTLWEKAEGLCVTSLGNILAPGLYSESDKEELGAVFDRLTEKIKTRDLPDMSAKDLHRKGWGTLISVLIWAMAVSQMMAFIPAVLAFVSGLGATMALFRFQSWGVRRDVFYRKAIALWREMNLRPHANGKLNGNGVGEDPFHLNRDFARHHFNAAQEALATEINGDNPTADVILLIAQSEAEQNYFQKKSQDPTLFRPDVPVVVLRVPEGKGSFYAYARAWTYLFSDDFEGVRSKHPHLRGRQPWELGVATVVSRSGSVDGMEKPLNELPIVVDRIGQEAVGHKTIFDLALMNAYRATQAGQRENPGGMVLRWADRAYVGPVRVPRGPGVRLDTFWANREEMARYNFGAVIASLGKPIELIRRYKNGKTLKTLVRGHSTRVYDLDNDRLKQYQAFSGEGVYVFDAAGAQAQLKFLQDVLDRANALEEQAPALNLMTYFLVPMAMSQGPAQNSARKISGYFAGQGFLTDPLPEKVQRFNHASANALAGLFAQTAETPLSLNPGFVDETIYVGAEDVEIDEDPAVVLSPTIPTTSKPIFSFARQLAVAALSFGFFVSAFSAPKPTSPPPAPEISVSSSIPRPSEPTFYRPPENNGMGRVVNVLRSQGIMTLELQSLMGSIPLDGRLTDQFAPLRVKSTGVSETAGAIVTQTALISLGHQISESWNSRQQGRAPEAEMGQTAFLLGLAGLPTPLDFKIHPVWGPLAQLFGTTDERAAAAWEQGAAARKTLLASNIGAPADTVEQSTVVTRVTELANSDSNDHRRAALIAKLKERAQRPRQSHDRDFLLVNGDSNLAESDVRRALEQAIPASLHSYLANCELIMIEKNELTLADVRTRLPLAKAQGRLLVLYTADFSAILVDPWRVDSTCRILLLEWMGGQLKTLDVLSLARAALETARVVSTKA